MTSAERSRFANTWNRFQQKYEKLYTQRFKAALQLQVKAYLKSQDVMSIPTFPIYNALTKLYYSIGPAWARIIKTESLKGMGFNEQIIALMKEYYGIDLLNNAELMTAYSRDVIVRVLQQAADQGLSIDNTVNMLLEHPEFNEMRARRIARTETVTAANGAAVVYAQTSGNVMDKVWISIVDNRSRHDHSRLDGTMIPMDQSFVINSTRGGTYEMMQPGVRTQPNGLAVPGFETVNCRCTIAFKARRDSRGRVIRS